MIVTSNHIDFEKNTNLGGKGGSLVRLKTEGFDVPDFVVLPATILSQGVTKDIVNEVLSFFRNDVLFAVRSSANIEDGVEYSFAGQFKSLLNVTAQDISDVITKVVASAKSPEVLAYIRDKDVDEIKMSVIVQEMVQADCSGVAFGINPLTGDESEKVINIVSGLGEGLVSGQKNADSYLLKNGKLIQRYIKGKELLTESMINDVVVVLDKLHNIYKVPQDIEFAFVDGRLKLLQSRPVTTRKESEAVVYDNSNIIESYPGKTLPLTFSFIEKMYASVYQQLSSVLGISKSRIKQNVHHYDNMLGLLNGQVYYNLNSWYSVLALLPGYNLNAEFMEGMMGVKDKPDILIKQPAKKTIADYLNVLKAVLYIVYNATTVKAQKRKFIKDFHAIYDKYNNADYAQKTLQETFEDYLNFERLMSSKWKAPLVNDFFAMIYFGVLQKMCAKLFPGMSGVHNQLISSTKDIITVQPLLLLPELSKLVGNNDKLKEMMLSETAEYVWNELQVRSDFTEQRIAIQNYIDKWGERCVAELKLETITYRQEPARLIAVLQDYIKNDIKVEERAITGTGAADKNGLVVKGSFVAKFFFKHVLRKTRYLVSNRENLRYYRTLGFGLVRVMMLAIGEKMSKKGLIEKDRDIFYLKLGELEQVINGEKQMSLKKLVDKRKKDYELFKDLRLPERVITLGKTEVVLASENEHEYDSQDELMGVPCSAGVVKATVCKVKDARGDMPQGQILVTYATDPGYVVMFPGAAGILTERGSLLSHAAIVSREMNIPCIVGIEGLMSQLNDGDEIIMDGSTGVVKVLNRTVV